MDQSTNQAIGFESLAESAEGKLKTQILSKYFSTYKIPIISLTIFGVIILRAIYPETFHFGFKRKNSYKFQSESLGFFIGDITFFDNSSYQEAEDQMVSLFPDKIRGKVKKVIRPVLILCEKHKVDPFWVLSVMWTESHFQQEVMSKKGARGLMQLMPSTYMDTLAEMKKIDVRLESDKGEDYLRYKFEKSFYDLGHNKLVAKLRNLEVGIFYLKSLLSDFNHNHQYATMAYNMGPYWLKGQLKNNRPVGKDNRYLRKVLNNYYHITKTLSQTTNVTFIPRI